MSTRTRYANESEIETAQPGAKLNFGDNLYLRVTLRGKKTFYFRVVLNGTDTTFSIGDATKLTLTDARRIAMDRQAQVTQVRQETANASFRQRLSATRQKREGNRSRSHSETGETNTSCAFIGFRSLEDAGKFVACLIAKKGSMSTALYYWLRLRLMVPSRSTDLLNLQWFNVDLKIGILKLGEASPRGASAGAPSSKVAALSLDALNLLREMHRFRTSNDFVFDELRRTPPSSLRYSIRQALQHTWPQYHVEPNEFAGFFEQVAMKYSFFNSALVEGMLAHRPGSPADYNHDTYVRQLFALSNWWAEALNWFAFGTSLIRWGGTSLPVDRATEQPRPQYTPSGI